MSSTRTRARAASRSSASSFVRSLGFFDLSERTSASSSASGACAKGFAFLPGSSDETGGAEISVASDDSSSEDSARSETRAASLGRGMSERSRARREREPDHLERRAVGRRWARAVDCFA